MNRESKINFIVSFLFYAVIAFLILIVLRYLLSPLLPFILAFAIASLTQKVTGFLTAKTFLSHRVCVTIITLLLITLTALLLYGIVSSLFIELKILAENLMSGDYLSEFTLSPIMTDFFERLENIFGTNAFMYKFKNIFSKADETLVKLLSQYTPTIISAVLKFLSLFPKAMVFTAFFVISLFYIGFDYEKIIGFFKLQTNEKIKGSLKETFDVFCSTLRKIIRAYALLCSITFIQLLCGFLILRIKYAFILSFIISIIDLFPILGTGTVLIPWCIICFISGNFVQGAGILALYAIITIFRQFAEPKIIGSHIGLNPLLSLISMYSGLKIMGFFGIILFPILLTTIISLNEKGIISLYKNVPETKKIKSAKIQQKFKYFKKHDK